MNRLPILSHVKRSENLNQPNSIFLVLPNVVCIKCHSGLPYKINMLLLKCQCILEPFFPIFFLFTVKTFPMFPTDRYN